MRQFPLPPRHEELLHKTFGQDQWREDKKLAGFSGASVYQIIYRNNPVVVKIASPAVIQREQAGYHDFVLDNLHHHAPKLGGYYESDDQQEAILRYTYAGSVARSQTLFEFLERPNQKVVQEVRTMLEKMFTLNQSDHPKSWWERAERKSIRSAEYYDRWLPVQLVLEQIPAAVESATLLHAQRLSLTDIAALTAGDIVLLQDFQVEKQEGGVVTLYAGRSQAPSLRVKVRGIQGDQGEAVPALYAVVKETRAMLLEDHAEEAVGAFAMHAPYFTVEGHEYHNPFYYLDELLNTRYEAYLATIHGDFNLRNILLEEKSQPGANALVRWFTNFLGQKSYDWWLIDFASAQTGPVLLDLQWLEAQVINWLLVPALQRAGQGPQTLAQVLEGLQRRRPLYFQYFQLRTGELHAIYALLQEIRRLAEGYLAEPAYNPDRWQEYYRGLTLALAATLKQEALSNELGQQAKKFALVAAATTVRWAGVKLATPVRQRWQPPSGRWLVAILVSLLAVAVIYGATQFLPGNPTEPPVTLTLTLPLITPLPATPTPTSAPAVAAVPTESVSILERVKARGHLRCGVNGDLPLFGWDPVTPKHRSWKAETPEDVDSYDNAEGFDADFCRVVATAIFGDYVGRVKFINVGPKERFQALTQQVIDVLSRNTTWTPDRDGGLGVDFTAVTFYTKQKLLVKKDTFQQWEELAEQRICVLPATTTLANLESLRPKMGWVAVTQDRDGSFANNQQVFDAFKADYCKAFTSDGDQLIAFTSQPKSGEDRLYFSPAEYEILEITDDAIPDEPRALVVAANDSHWRKVVSYAVWATIYAEELGITQRNVETYLQSSELRFKEFLGVPDELIPPGGQIGEALNLPAEFARNIIARLGNYGEIYTRHLQQYIPNRGANQSWKLNRAGRLFTPPFVLAQLAPPAPAPPLDKTSTPVPRPLTIGVAIDLQDKESLLGDNQEKAAKVAVELYHNAVPGVEIQLEIKNTNSSTEGAVSAVNTLIAKDVLFIIGPTLSSQAKIVDPIANANKIPIIGPSNTAKGIAQLGCYVSRISAPVTQLDPLAVTKAYLEYPGIRNVAVAYLQGNAFTEDEAQVFMAEATRTDLDRNWNLVVTQPYTRGAEIDFTSQAETLLQAQPDLVMVAGLTKDGGLLVKKLREQGYTGVIIGGNGFNTTGIFNVCQGACNNIILAQAYDSRPNRMTGVNRQFIQTYEQAYQSVPSPIAAQMFTAIQVSVEALNRIAARTQDGLTTMPLPALRDELNKELLAGEPFPETPLGEIDFAADGEVIQQEFYVARIEIDANGEHGKFVTFTEGPNEAVDILRATPSDCPDGYLPQ